MEESQVFYWVPVLISAHVCGFRPGVIYVVEYSPWRKLDLYCSSEIPAMGQFYGGTSCYTWLLGPCPFDLPVISGKSNFLEIPKLLILNTVKLNI